MSAWALLGVAGVAGLLFSLYRNDVLLSQARRGGWEPRYLAFEARLLGRPGWGTPRSLSSEPQAGTPEPRVALAAGAPAAAALPARAPQSEPAPTAVPSAVAAAAAPVAAAPAAPVAAATAVASASPARSTSDGVAIVSLDALGTLPVEPPAPARAAVAAAAPPRRSAESAPPARAVPARAVPIAPVAKAPPPAPVAKAPVAAAPPVNENPLKAAIRTAIVKESQAK